MVSFWYTGIAEEWCLNTFHLVILICLFRGWHKPYGRDLIQQMLIPQIRARVLCSALTLWVPSTTGRVLPTLLSIMGFPVELHLSEVQLSCTPFIVL